jgi:hypothetical protein
VNPVDDANVARMQRLLEDDGFNSPMPFREHPQASQGVTIPASTTLPEATDAASEARMRRLLEDDGFNSPMPFCEHPQSAEVTLPLEDHWP